MVLIGWRVPSGGIDWHTRQQWRRAVRISQVLFHTVDQLSEGRQLWQCIRLIQCVPFIVNIDLVAIEVFQCWWERGAAAPDQTNVHSLKELQFIRNGFQQQSSFHRENCSTAMLAAL